jgi:nucleotide sugar dehydrogenase
MKIAVIGLGKIGLPLAVQFASKGFKVVGFDIDEKTVSLINSGKEPFPEELELEERLSNVVSIGALRATTDPKLAIESATHIVVVVPLFVDVAGSPDFRTIDRATSDIGKYIKPGTLVAYETTLPVGTTRKRFTRSIAEISGLKAGVEFFVVFSPERVLTGRIFSDLRRYPKIVGGINTESSGKGVDFYEQVLDFDENSTFQKPNGVWNVGNCETSEMVKLAETTYRDVNIGLANQFAIFASENNIDIDKVIDASNSQPFSHIHTPGIAVGGHCIPIYPHFFMHNFPGATVVQAARTTNKGMPAYFVNRLENMLGDLAGKQILILGLSYREKVKEHAFSGVFDIVEQLELRGAIAFVEDPLYSDEEIGQLGLRARPINSDLHAVVLHTKHDEYRSIDFAKYGAISAVVDGRGFLDKSKVPKDVQYFSF